MVFRMDKEELCFFVTEPEAVKRHPLPDVSGSCLYAGFSGQDIGGSGCGITSQIELGVVGI